MVRVDFLRRRQGSRLLERWRESGLVAECVAVNNMEAEGPCTSGICLVAGSSQCPHTWPPNPGPEASLTWLTVTTQGLEAEGFIGFLPLYVTPACKSTESFNDFLRKGCEEIACLGN